MDNNTDQQLLKYFLYLGATGFGGPLAIIHQIRQEFVEKRKVIEASDFDQAFTLIKAMPGPIAIQLAIFCGKKLEGYTGAFKAAVGLVAPAFILMLLMALYYDQLTSINQVKTFFVGMQFSVAAVMLASLRPLVLPYKSDYIFWALLVLAGTLFYLKLFPESLLIVGFGLVWILINHFKSKTSLVSVAWPAVFLFDADKLAEIFKTCFMAGALVFGTGLAVFPFFQTAFVEKYQWLSISVFNDAVTFGQMTPGPVTISTTFMGFKMAGLWGAFVATTGLFLPPFLHISTWFIPALNWFKKQKWVKTFLFGSTAAVVGCISVTVYKMNAIELLNYKFWLIFLLSIFTLLRFKKISILSLLIASGFLHLVLSFAA